VNFPRHYDPIIPLSDDDLACLDLHDDWISSRQGVLVNVGSEHPDDELFELLLILISATDVCSFQLSVRFVNTAKIGCGTSVHGSNRALPLKQAALAARYGEVEVFVGEAGGDAAAGGAVEEADLDEEGFVDFFEGVFFFG